MEWNEVNVFTTINYLNFLQMNAFHHHYLIILSWQEQNPQNFHGKIKRHKFKWEKWHQPVQQISFRFQWLWQKSKLKRISRTEWATYFLEHFIDISLCGSHRVDKFYFLAIGENSANTVLCSNICNFDCFVIYYDWIHFVKLNCILMWENRFCVDRNWSAWRKMTSIFQHNVWHTERTRTLQDIRPNFLFTRNHKMHR